MGLPVALAGKVQEHEAAVAKLRPEAKLAEDRLEGERDGALSCYHGVLRSVWAIVKSGDEPNANHADTLTKLLLLFKEGRNISAPPFAAGLFHDQDRILKHENALEVNELELQTLLGLAEEYAKVCSDISRLWNSVKMLSRESSTVQLVRENVRDSQTLSRDVRTKVDALKKQNAEL